MSRVWPGSARGNADLPLGGRVALVAVGFPLSSETFVVDQFVHLVDRGWDVHVVATSSDPADWQFFPRLQARHDLVERVHVSSNIGQELRTLRPDLIHFEFGSLAAGLMHLKDAIGCKTLVSFRGFDICFHGLERPGYYEEVWARADMLHFVSHDLLRRARQRGCPPEKPHVVIADAADVTAFDPGEREYPESVGNPARPFRILGVGRLVWKKGYEYALEAVQRLVDAGIFCEYRIVGEGESRAQVLFTIHDFGLTDSVRLLGKRSRADIKTQMQWADVFLHASVSEGFGVSVIEAQAMGLPVVTSDAEGLAENVADGETGFVVPRRDAAALSDRLRLLAGDRWLRQRMGQAGQQRARTELRQDLQMDRFERLYRQTLDVRLQAELLEQEILADPAPTYAGDLALAADMERVFRSRARVSRS